MVSAASSARPWRCGTLPVVDVLDPDLPLATQPERAGRLSSRPPDSLCDWEMKAVLHEIAKSWLNGTVPATDSPWKLWNICPPTLIADTQGTGVSGVTPGREQPVARHHLERRPGRQPALEPGVEGGCRRPVGHREHLPRRRPDRDQRGHVTDGESTVPSAVSAAACTLGSMVRRHRLASHAREGGERVADRLAVRADEHDRSVGSAGKPGLICLLDADWSDQRVAV